MKEVNNGKNRLQEKFSTVVANGSEENGFSQQSIKVTRQYYEVAPESDLPKRFRIQLRSGEVFSFPYSLLPIFNLNAGKELTIMAYELHISIMGRNLGVVEDNLTKERITWLRESLSQKDDGEGSVFIGSITIKGKAVDK